MSSPTPTTVLPIQADLTIYQGATFRRHWRWLSGGTPVDMTGWLGRMQIRKTVTATDTLLSLTTANGGVVLTADGDVELFATDEQTKAIPFNGVYDVELEEPAGGDVFRFAMGRITLSAEVTR